VDRDGLINVAKECAKANCKLVVISSALVSPHNYLNPIRFMLNRVFKWGVMDAKWQGEQEVRKTEGLRYTIIRPGQLSDSKLPVNEFKVGQGDAGLFASKPISKESVGHMAVTAAVDPESEQVTIEVAGASEQHTIEGMFNGLKKDPQSG